METEKYKEREFLAMIVVAAVYVFGLFTDRIPETHMTDLFNLLMVTVGGFQISRGLAKSKKPVMLQPSGAPPTALATGATQ